MDSTALNSSSINGASSPSWIQAFAAITATAAVEAVAVRQYDANAAQSAGASLVAFATHTHDTYASVVGTGSLYPIISTVHYAEGDSSSSSAEIQAYILGYVSGTANVICTSEIIAIPASVLGHADVASDIQIVAEATKIQHGSSSFTAIGNVSITVEPEVTRYVEALITGSNNVRVESSLNEVVDAYSDVTGSSTLEVEGLVHIMQAAVVACTATIQANLTLEQAANVNLTAGTSLSFAVLEVTQPTLAWFSAGSELEATATKILNGTVNIICSSETLVYTNQQHSGNVACTTVASISATAQLTQPMFANVVVNTSTLATASKTAYALASVTGSSVIAATAWLQLNSSSNISAVCQATASSHIAHSGNVSLVGSAAMSSQAIRNVLGLVNVVTYTDLTANITNTLSAASSIDGIADIAADSLRTAYSYADAMGNVTITADPITNPEAIDLDKNVFMVAARTTEFVRPFIETEFRRAA